MNRTGIRYDNLEQLVDIISNLKILILKVY